MRLALYPGPCGLGIATLWVRTVCVCAPARACECACVCVLHGLRAAGANRERMGGTAGLLSAIVGGMSAHMANADVQRAGLEALWQLASHGTTRCGAHSVGVWRMGVCLSCAASVLQASLVSMHRPVNLWQSCAGGLGIAMWWVCMAWMPLVLCAADSNQERMGSTAGLLSALVGGMSADEANADVQRAGLEALRQLLRHGTTQCSAKRRRVGMCACVEQPVLGGRLVPLCTGS